jgi:methionyl-tRNA formyltransferase
MSKIVFAGSGMPLEKTLAAAVSISGIEVSKAYLHNDSKDQRIKSFCKKHSILTGDINQLRKDCFSTASIPRHDYFFSVNSTIIFPPEVLAFPDYGALNMHPGRLPDYAGLHTHQWAIRNGEKCFASTLHWMETTLDTGPIAYIEHFDMRDKETGLSLFIKCLGIGAKLVVQALETVAKGNPLPRLPQDLHTRQLYKENDAMQSKIDWNWAAHKIERFIRAADYGFSQSPTYQSVFSCAASRYLIKKAHCSNEIYDGIPKEVIKVTPTRVYVRAGDCKSIVITKMQILNTEKNQYENFKFESLKKGMIVK